MAFTKTFTAGLDWSNGETIDETRLDQMVNNAEYLRDELQFQQIIRLEETYSYDGSQRITSWPVLRTLSPASGSTPWEVYVSVDGTKLFDGVNFAQSSDAEESEKDFPLSGLVAGGYGLRELTVGISHNDDGPGASGSYVTKFVLTQDTQYLSAWWKRGSIEGTAAGYIHDIAYVNRMTIVLHREAMGW